MQLFCDVLKILFMCAFVCCGTSCSASADCASTADKMTKKNEKEVSVNQNSAKQIAPTTSKNAQQEHIFRETTAEDGAKVIVTVDGVESSLFKLKGEGFKADEALRLISRSCDEALRALIKADKNGNIPCVLLLPAVKGKSGGICYIDIVRDKEVIHIQLPWGDAYTNIENN